MTLRVVDSPIDVVVRLLQAQGVSAYAEQDIVGVGSLYYSGTAEGAAAVIERVYGVGYYWSGDRLMFGGEADREWVRLSLGGADAEEMRSELRQLLPRGSSMAILGEDVIVATSPGNARALADTSLVSDRSYNARMWLVSVDRGFQLGVSGSADIGVSGDIAGTGSGISYSAVLDYALQGGTDRVRVVDSVGVSLPGGRWGKIKLTDDRFFEVFDVVGEDGETVRSGFERREAGLRLRVLVRDTVKGVAVRFELEKSRFEENSSKRVTEASGSARVDMGEPVMIARLRQQDASSSWGLLSGVSRRSSSRDILVLLQVGT